MKMKIKSETCLRFGYKSQSNTLHGKAQINHKIYSIHSSVCFVTY